MTTLRRFALRCALTVSIVAPASAADPDGLFAIKGSGTATCAEFLEARRAATPAYYLFGGWLNGYLTARNHADPATFDLAPWQTTDMLAIALEDICKPRPQESFFRAVETLVAGLREQRLQVRSEAAQARVGASRVVLYEATVRQLQERLAALGHLREPPDGVFGPETEAAVRKFQTAQDIPVSGVPNQLTLLRLFYGR